MNPERIKRIVGEIPYMTLRQARIIGGLIRENGIRDILELGFYHGVSTCYLADAVCSNGGGTVTSLDLEGALELSPNIEQLLQEVGLSDRVTFHADPQSYVWRLMKMLEEDPTPRFDLVYIDGSHQWKTDGFAFFLADRLLRPGGWLILDDLDWKLANYPHLKGTEWAKTMGEEEKNTAQIRKVYELLVRSHPDYGEFKTEMGWAFAHKRGEATLPPTEVRREVVIRHIPMPMELIRRQMKAEQ